MSARMCQVCGKNPQMALLGYPVQMIGKVVCETCMRNVQNNSHPQTQQGSASAAQIRKVIR